MLEGIGGQKLNPGSFGDVFNYYYFHWELGGKVDGEV